ncbi:tRNA (N6-threonylcarbamoyladenosine(37)-N6)-methyltransferase TrmO [Candidatus Aminicenantes bacterium AC-708-M15]|jgi:tRNA-Thr(GGU) m(6)t(6)A37 methyltransferase TsaA|nr:tRNA (N6-threonylcarbamoyladenosine(37)-N6)-methyltransferase TrmO [SCandidatus Aminicenantes bacterium Aminicenantia_JdfR_composite]MCP2596488.1 tRNA (N6-threonylcarbamoyladenosine(37)-N6)-methyltransferase TrmO [Candidatus Aminicenantes bacterium AC-335-G13]MCP2598125.1 tRNA (N6-threonylcarbamoyladenosine(37)-N6)-methyltransferase TrmO [Candidatus Aminicenantes bacterium AC-335-L06]MCP2603884.1 tRNA (N6-threonylcarbamoyladenosine(37)-N6)-methyltransferase TrmO [Candidatus Aminicenantes bact
MKNFKLKPIGIIHSSYKKPEDIPKEERKLIEGEIEIFKEFEDGLKDIDGFSHLIVIFVLHKSCGYNLQVTPPFDNEIRGVFATRSPYRPNPIGMTIVELLERKENILRVKGIDMIEGTPVVDIKPYLPGDRKENIKIGWLTGKIED